MSERSKEMSEGTSDQREGRHVRTGKDIFRPFRLPPKNEPPEAKEARERREKLHVLTKFLDTQIKKLEATIAIEKKMLWRGRSDPLAIKDTILGLTMQKESLEETRVAVLAGKPIPADAKATLTILRRRSEKAIQEDIKLSDDPKHDREIIREQFLLEDFDSAMRDLEM